MSNTRRQDPATKRFCQTAFSSSAEYDFGILGNLVAARCHQLEDPEEIAMLWWLQQVSWREGGFEKFARDFLPKSEAQLGTASMRKFGVQAGRIYTADEVRIVRAELNGSVRDGFPLSGEEDLYDGSFFLSDASPRKLSLPRSYPASAFVNVCRPTIPQFVDSLRHLLLDPQTASPKKGLPYFAGLWDALTAWRAAEVAAASGRIVETAVSRQVFDELDFALDSRGFVVIEGREGIGKTEAVRAWCDRQPGRVLYVRLESSSDEGTFYRSISRRLGTASTYARKAHEVRTRIEDALQPGHLMLVVDEAHFLWPMSERSERGAPKRIDWLRTALVDAKVPVALISTPQFFERQCDRFRKHGWNANQVQRRLTRTARLPEALSAEDAIAVARNFFPSVPLALAKRIAGVALISVGYLTSIEHLRKRVDFFRSRREGVSEIALVEEAVTELAAAQGISTQPPQKQSATSQEPHRAACAPAVPAPTRSGNVTIPQSLTACV